MTTARAFGSISFALLLVAAFLSPSPAEPFKAANLATGDLDDDGDEQDPLEQIAGDADPITGNAAREFEVQVFGSQDPSVREAARGRLSALLHGKIASIGQICGLLPAQREKLYLAGLGDIQHLFGRVEDQKGKYQLIPFEQPGAIVGKIGNLRAFREVRDPQFDAVMQRLRQDAYPMQAALASGPFDDASILSKCLQTTLNADQFARYAAIREVERAGGQVKICSLAGAEAVYEINLVGRRLQYVAVEGTRVTDAGVAELCRAVSGLTVER